MSVVRISVITPSVILGVWHINEDAKVLLSQLHLSKAEEKIYASFKHDLRRKQWLSYRILIRLMLPELSDYTIEYEKSGKPRLANTNFYISISHAGDYSAVIISRDAPVGIDIEKIHPRLRKVAHKFLYSFELVEINGTEDITKLCVYWCAKEAIYKCCGIRELTFEEIKIELQKSGNLCAKVFHKEKTFFYPIYYETIDDYILAYVY